MNADPIHADAAGYVLEDTPDDIRERMFAFYADNFADQLAPLVAAGEITRDEAVHALRTAMAQPVVRDSIESFVARVTGGLH